MLFNSIFLVNLGLTSSVEVSISRFLNRALEKKGFRFLEGGHLENNQEVLSISKNIYKHFHTSSTLPASFPFGKVSINTTNSFSLRHVPWKIFSLSCQNPEKPIVPEIYSFFQSSQSSHSYFSKTSILFYFHQQLVVPLCTWGGPFTRNNHGSWSLLQNPGSKERPKVW